jgi:hypothetical protein
MNIVYIDIQCSDIAKNVWKDLDRATEVLNSLGYHSDIIVCKVIRADMDLREHKFNLAQLEFQECLHSTLGMVAEIESLCLERLANIGA